MGCCSGGNRVPALSLRKPERRLYRDLQGRSPFFQNTGLGKGTNYYYKVSYVGSDGVESATSPALLVRTTIPFPGVPSQPEAGEGELPERGVSLGPGQRGRSPVTSTAPPSRAGRTRWSTRSISRTLSAPRRSTASSARRRLHYYVVAAVNERGEFGSSSAEVSVTTPSRAEDLIQNAGFWCPGQQRRGDPGAWWLYTLKFGDTYYWYGEDKRHNSASFRNVSVYASQDLVHWSFATMC